MITNPFLTSMILLNFMDLVEGVSLTETLDDATGISAKSVTDWKSLSKNSELKHRITLINEKGSTLSGGQKQRITIARTLLKNPRIIILDEATSALDINTERLVMQSINSIDKNITLIMIAHRLSTLKECDRIITLQNGAII